MKLILCLIALFFSGNSHSETLGRLFFSPEQRSKPPHSAPTPNEPAPASEQLELSPPRASYTIHINGLIESSRGNRTVWVNQQAHQLDNSLPADQLPLQIADQILSLPLQVGAPLTLSPQP